VVPRAIVPDDRSVAGPTRSALTLAFLHAHLSSSSSEFDVRCDAQRSPLELLIGVGTLHLAKRRRPPSVVERGNDE
jgi:hypothetical protein